MDAKFLQAEGIEELNRKVNQALKEPWTIGETENLPSASWASLTKGEPKDRTKNKVKLTATSKIGKFLRSPAAWSWLNQSLKPDVYDRLIHHHPQTMPNAAVEPEEADKKQWSSLTPQGSGHDQYFYRHQAAMVAGAVAPPKLELANQDLIESHIYSVWLGLAGVHFDDSMNQILDLEQPKYPLKADLRAQLEQMGQPLFHQNCVSATRSILADTFCQTDLNRVSWYSPEWLERTISNALIEFNNSCDRWRKLYIYTYLPTGKDRGEYISHPRHLAIREMAPQNILYYEGNKFKVDRTKRYTQGIDSRCQPPLVICDRCGYFHTKLIDVCENCGNKPTSDRSGKPAVIIRALELDPTSGQWEPPTNKTDPQTSIQADIHLTVKATTNLLSIEPLDLPEHERESFITTFQYALERSIQTVYKLEQSELDSERLGQNSDRLLFWEAAEGGAGVLSQILEDPQSFQKLAVSALEICHFIEHKDSCAQACYECLLSYGNQWDHPLLNRHTIGDFLNRLRGSKLERHSIGLSREEQYQQLLAQTDPNSEFERVVLTAMFIYLSGNARLPSSIDLALIPTQ